ncbi:hypothetical protein TNCV_2076281 [Trichonephila clavipes]|nr:hypothetical protein TNCV_2076281 [Trichonephila clavipes]
MSFSRRVYPERRGTGFWETLLPTSLGSNTIHFWSPTNGHCKARTLGVCPTSILSSRPRDMGVNEELDVAIILVSLY